MADLIRVADMLWIPVPSSISQQISKLADWQGVPPASQREEDEVAEEAEASSLLAAPMDLTGFDKGLLEVQSQQQGGPSLHQHWPSPCLWEFAAACQPQASWCSSSRHHPSCAHYSSFCQTILTSDHPAFSSDSAWDCVSNPKILQTLDGRGLCQETSTPDRAEAHLSSTSTWVLLEVRQTVVVMAHTCEQKEQKLFSRSSCYGHLKFFRNPWVKGWLRSV